MAELEVGLAGAISLRRGTRQVADPAFRGVQLRLVTAMLVLDRRDPVPVDRLAEQLWSDTLPTHWRVGLRGVVARLRRILVDLGMPPEAIRGESGRYLVELGDVRVDLEAAEVDVVEARRLLDVDRVDQARDRANTARTVLSRPILSGIDTPWVDAVRDRAEGRHVDVLTLLATCRSRLGHPEQARSVINEALDLDPFREDAWRTLMRVEVAAGNGAAALLAYEDCRRRLAEHLGVDPSPATRELHAQVLEHHDETASHPITEVAPSAPGPARPVLAGDLEPYVGLRAFRRDDAMRFFGRDGEVQALVERLQRDRIVVVVGPSGVGKSSLVRAGLLSALDRGAIPDSDTWTTVTLLPGVSPLKSMAAELVEAVADLPGAKHAQLPTVDEFAGVLSNDVDGLHGVAGRVLRGRESTARLLVVVDQFEEVFTLADQDRVAHLVRLLTTAAMRLDGRVLVVVTMRADFYDRAVSVPPLAQLLSSAQVAVPPLEGEQVEAAVAGPARAVGARLEPGLLARILTDVAGEPGSLPLLQHLLQELWGRRTDRVMTRGAYEDVGGVAGALAQRAEAVFTSLDADDRRTARRVLLRGVQPGRDAGDARRPIDTSELLGPHQDGRRTLRVVDRLVEERLLTADARSRPTTSPEPRGVPGGDGPNDQSRDQSRDQPRDQLAAAPGGHRVLELAHEALIDGWPRLRAWVDDVRGWLLDHRRLTTAARAWEDHERHDDWLLVGRRLDAAREVVVADRRGDVDLHLSPSEHSLVEASLAAMERDRAREAARLDRERRLEVRSARWLRALVGVVMVVALVAAVAWFDASRDARLAAVRQLVSAAEVAIDQDPQDALQLALGAHARLPANQGDLAREVETVLRASVQADRLVALWPGRGEYLATSPVTNLVAVARGEVDEQGWPVDLLDPDTGQVQRTLAGHGGSGRVWMAAFSADGTRLATGSRDGALHLWDPTTGQQVARLAGPGATATWASFDADVRRVATSFNDDEFTATVQVWDLEAEGVVHDFTTPDPVPGVEGAPAQRAVFSPDGTRVAVAHWAQPGSEAPPVVTIVDATDWAEVARVEVHAVDVAWSPNGSQLALSGNDGTVVVDPVSGDVVRDLRGPGVEGGVLAWNDEGSVVAVGTEQEVQLWMVDRPDAAPTVLRGPRLGGATLDFLDDSRLVTGNAVDVSTWDARTGPVGEVATLPADRWQPGLDYDPSGAWLAVSSGEGIVTLHDTTSWEAGRTLSAHGPNEVSPDFEATWVIALDWSPDGTTLATSGADDLAVWDPESGLVLHRFDTAGGWNAVATSAVGGHLAVTTDGGEGVAVLDESGEVVARRSPSPGRFVSGVRFHPNGHLLALARSDRGGAGDSARRDVVVWDWARDEDVARLESETWDVDWHPDGNLVVTAESEPRVWDVESGAVVQTLVGHEQNVQDATWGPTGKRIATCSGDGTARLWAADTGEQLQVLASGLRGFCQVRFSPDGDHVAISEGGPVSAVLVHTLDLDELAGIAASQVVDPWTAEECAEALPGAPCPG